MRFHDSPRLEGPKGPYSLGPWTLRDCLREEGFGALGLEGWKGLRV